MKARDLIAELMRHDLDLEVYAQVSIVGPNNTEEVDVPLNKVKRENDGGPRSPRVVIEAEAEITAKVEYTFEIDAT